MAEENVKVLVRCRPFNEREAKEGAFNVIDINKQMGQVVVIQPESKDITGKDADQKVKHTFTFDAAYGFNNATKKWSAQTEVFDETCRPAVEFVLKGYNSTIFAYGQTGSGKTYTMMGYGAELGVIPQSIQRIFDYIETSKDDISWLIKASFYEIYNEQIRDLMTGATNLPLHDSPQKGVYIEGLSEYQVGSDREISELMERGNKHRSVASTKMNATSSRSHSVFQIVVEACETIDGQDTVRVGKLNLVDLAGSERQSKTEATGDRLKEGAKINLSLTNLGIVIQKLVDGDPHIPFRQSKLTHILANSLGGNSKTLMVVAISPASTNYDETMSTLRYADRAKRIKNKARINEDPKDQQIRQMRERIEELEKLLSQYLSGKPPSDAEGVAAQAEAIMGIQAELQRIKVVKKTKIVKKSPEEILKFQQEQQKLLEELEKKQAKSEKARELVEKFQQQIEQQKQQLQQQKKQELEQQQEEQERQLRIARQQLADQKVAEQELKRKLAQQEEIMDKTEFANIQERILAYKKKLEVYADKKFEMEDELDQLQAENANQRQKRADEVERLQMQISGKQAILDWFIPASIQQRLLEKCVYDEKLGEWKLAGQEVSGNSRRGL